jgi:nucleotide-binding universal stress UspA family protein
MSLEDIEAMPQARKLPRDAKETMRVIHNTLREGRTVDADVHQYVPALPSLIDAIGEIILDEAESLANRKKAGKVTRVIDEGDAATQILKQATKAKADLIVMGTRGLSNFRGLLIGSVSNKVIHNSKCATLTVK